MERVPTIDVLSNGFVCSFESIGKERIDAKDATQCWFVNAGVVRIVVVAQCRRVFSLSTMDLPFTSHQH